MNHVVNAALRIAVAIPVGTEVLQIGLHDGALAKAFTLLSLDYFGCDPDRTTVDSVRKDLQSLITDVGGKIRHTPDGPIPFEDGRFEWVFWCGDHPENDQALMIAEVERLLKSGGWVWLAYRSDGQLRGPNTGFHEAGFAEASAESQIAATETSERIFRKIDSNTPL